MARSVHAINIAGLCDPRKRNWYSADAADTIAVGGGLVDAAVALGIAREAAPRIHDLLTYGVPFDRDLEGRLAVGREAAHSARRIVHVRGDGAGAAIIAALSEAVRRTPSIRVIEGLVAEALLTETGAATGLVLREAGNSVTRPLLLAARAVVREIDSFLQKHR